MDAGLGPTRDRAFTLLAAANNHGDLNVKLSSLKQVKDILLSSPYRSSLSPEVFPFLVELQSSPEPLVRKTLIEVVENTGFRSMEHLYMLMPVLVASLEDIDSNVVCQSILSGIHLFCRVLEEMTLHFQRHGRVEKWMGNLWAWMFKFKDAVFAISFEPSSIKAKLLALKFLKMCVLLFTHDTDVNENSSAEGKHTFNISWLDDGHPILEQHGLNTEAMRAVGILLNLLRPATRAPGPVMIFVVSCLAAISRKRPIYYSNVLAALLEFDPNSEMVSDGHSASIRYCIRTAFLGFLRCTHPAILESRDRLLRALRAMNAGDAADQVIRQVDKMMKNNDRSLRDARKDDQLSIQLPASGDSLRKRPMFQNTDEPSNGYEQDSKRVCYLHSSHTMAPSQMVDSGQNDPSLNGSSPNVSLLDADMTPVEQMITMICAFLAKGERGAESLELLVSKLHPDVLADIVINNMKHLPHNPPPLAQVMSMPASHQMGASNLLSQVLTPAAPLHLNPIAQGAFASVTASSVTLSEIQTDNSVPAEAKRDPRRDPRRLDPRRVVETIKTSSLLVSEDAAMPSGLGDTTLLGNASPLPPVAGLENSSVVPAQESETDDLENLSILGMDQSMPKEEPLDEFYDTHHMTDVDTTSDLVLPRGSRHDENSPVPTLSSGLAIHAAETLSPEEFDQHSPDVSSVSTPEESSQDLPSLPPYIDLAEERQSSVRNLAFERIIEGYKHLGGQDYNNTRMELLACLVAQSKDDGDGIDMLQKHICSDYRNHKGHELALHILYHLHVVMLSDSVESSSYAATTYEKFLLAVANSLLETLPASDKAFSRLLGEVPFLPESALKLLDDLCYSAYHRGKVARDFDRVTQGLGAVWSLILGRPPNRQACLDIALKCTIHPQDEIRAKAIRLVANKLYLLSFISESIEGFATKMILLAVDQRVRDTDSSQSRLPSEQKTEAEVGSQETSISGSQISEPGMLECDSMKVAELSVQDSSTKSSQDSHRFISLFFALCTKKPSLLQLVFNTYGRAPNSVRQAVHRHIPVLVRTLGSSCLELLRIISDPPQGSEDLLSAVLQILTEDKAPPPDLIATVKHLYETKLKDASILIPVLSSLSKNEVLPVFPRLVNLPLEKFQKALAYILQGSAHTGPALTPAEVLVAIHDIAPEKDGIPLKKITDACSACFEQKIVFTQQVLAKALNQMVDQTPLPLLFMRTVIQAIDAFPTLVDFVMEILLKLVSKQVWRMPKLWVGFLKCISQTQPHSFHVLLRLPPPQLESALNRYSNLKSSLAAYANQPSVKPSLSRSTLGTLGLANDSHIEQPHVTSLHPMEKGSIHEATPT